MSEDYETKETERTTSVNRRRFVKALGMTGGAAVSGSVFSSPAKAAPSGQSSSVSKCSVTGDELNNFIHNIMKHDDIINIIDMTFREVVQEGTITGVSHNGPTDVAIITSDPSPNMQENSLDDLAKNDMIVSAARHTRKSGNKLTAITFVTGGGKVVWYHKYDTKENGVKTKSRLLNFDVDKNIDDVRLVAEKTSVNGTLTKSPSAFPNGHCPGCVVGPRLGGYRSIQPCKKYDGFCLGSCCAACGGCKGCLPCTVACAMTWCIGCMGYCCEEYGHDCQEC